MIEVKGLRKNFDRREVLRGLDFKVSKGEVVALLGVNGAGKTTTLRILATYLMPTSGSIRIDKRDFFANTGHIRRCVGYMPERVPLYNDMRVGELLRFRASLWGLRGKRRRKAVVEAIEICGLKDARAQIIGTLSKGYRQRLGIADALAHDPKLLILDEPTSGLDPNQIREMRQIFRDLSQTRTILLSTHSLYEAEKVCSRFLIMREGRLAGDGTLKQLRNGMRNSGDIFVRLKADKERALALLGELPGLRKLNVLDENLGWLDLSLRTRRNIEARELIAELAARESWPLHELRRRAPGLDEIFNELTFTEYQG